MPHRPPAHWLVFFFGLISVDFPNAAAAEKVDYATQIKPLFRHCHACHGALRQQAGLRVDTAASLRRGGDSGAAIVPGKSADSLLIQALTGTQGATRMPPEEEAAPLPGEVIETIRAWIDQGAEAAPESEPPGPRQHWSFQRPIASPDSSVMCTVR